MEAIGNDEALQAVCKYVKEGWPDALTDVCKIAKPYYCEGSTNHD